MKKTILVTGSTDGIGKATAKTLLDQGHRVLIHGRSKEKLASVKTELSENQNSADIETYAADLSNFEQVKQLAEQVAQNHGHLDVLINNAGVFKVPQKIAANGLDVRFVVNTIAPYLLTLKLIPLLGKAGRVINLSSAAQAPLDPSVLNTPHNSSDDTVYAQSKLALTMWSRHLAQKQGADGPIIVAINPASLLGSNMVKEAYGIEGKDLQVGADILVRAALSDKFANASGLYFDNDRGQFSNPHPDALDPGKIRDLTQKLDAIIASQ
ncbi:MAG: SDR family NAD(P)-dependent oxidoreductase [Gammaproteobacteria bacterium]|nr:SDR family NAD(P)-dependent oxidoreductase [Gammaproteobacteria bacterium]